MDDEDEGVADGFHRWSLDWRVVRSPSIQAAMRRRKPATIAKGFAHRRDRFRVGLWAMAGVPAVKYEVAQREVKALLIHGSPNKADDASPLVESREPRLIPRNGGRLQPA